MSRNPKIYGPAGPFRCDVQFGFARLSSQLSQLKVSGALEHVTSGGIIVG